MNTSLLEKNPNLNGAYDLSTFCEHPLQDVQHAWNSAVPDLGLCVERTVLVWIPCVFFWIFAPLYVWVLKKKLYDPISWTLLSYIKVGMTSILILTCISQIIWSATRKPVSHILKLDILASVLLMLTCVFYLYLVYLCRRNGVRSSSFLWMVWSLMLVCGVPQLYTSLHSTMYLPEKYPAAITVTFFIQYLCMFVLFVCNSIMDDMTKTQKLSPDKNRSPEIDASFPNRLTFWWNIRIIHKGWKRTILEEDLWNVIPKHRVAKVFGAWQSFFTREKGSGSFASKKNRSKQKESPSTKIEVSLYKVLWLLAKRDLIYSAVLKVFSVAAIFVTPQLLSPLIGFIMDKDQPEWRGYFYSLCLLFVCSVNTLIKNKMLYVDMNLTTKIRSSLMAAVYQKALRLSVAVRRESTIGQIVNLMAVDAQAVGDASLFLNNTITSPTTAFIALVLLWQNLGPSVLAGVAFLMLMIPFNSFVARKGYAIQASAMKHKDKRVKVVSEIINGIKVLKLYAWENDFSKVVEDIRDQEIKLLKRAGILQSFVSFIYQLIPNLIALVTFTTYLLVSEDNTLDAKSAFVSIALFNIMRFPVNLMPVLINALIQANVALKRIQKFLSSREIDATSVISDHSKDYDILIKDGQFSWDDVEGEATWQLNDINMQIPNKKLVAVVGTVGAGKTSLISALLGEMTKDSGKVIVNGSIAYVSQEAWLQNSTLRENIIWGQPFESKKYYQIVKACALEQDLDMLPDGDMTEIGERGINMSGGQKQRISLARAVYSDSDIYLLDDPLSAVDAHVSRHIFDNVIGPKGILKDKTRLLVTHGLTYLPQVDSVIVMQDGRIVETGLYEQLMEDGGKFSLFVQQHLHSNNNTDLAEESEIMQNEINDRHQMTQKLKVENFKGSSEIPKHAQGVLRKRTISEKGESDPTEKYFQSKFESRSLYDINNCRDSQEMLPLQPISHSLENGIQNKTKSNSQMFDNNAKSKDPPQKLVQEEESETGKVGLHIYLLFAKAMGLLYVILPVFFTMFSQLSVAGGNVWLSAWSSGNSDHSLNHEMHPPYKNVTFANGLNMSTSTYSPLDISNHTESFDRYVFLIGYGAFGFFQAAFMFIGVFLVTMGCLQASNQLHKDLTARIVHLPISFFDTNPSGRIINRFSKEINTLDIVLPGMVRGALSYCTQIVVTLGVIIAATPAAAVFIIPIMAIYSFLHMFFIASYRQLKRIESVTKSPVFSHFSETIQGATVIRAFKKQDEFLNESVKRIERSQKVQYILIGTNRWLGVQLEMLGNLITFAAALLAVVARHSISPGTVGMSVSYALYITVILSWLVRVFSDVEASVVSVERINEYLKREPEAPWRIEGHQPRVTWPEEGQLSFTNYQTQYRPGLELVLKGISFSIKPAEKIGVVGRTGAGKSSLTLALFRLIEPTGGEITIDHVNISKIGLHDLRSQLSIIPQDPVLFSGTLRLNLDPSGKRADVELWQALELAHLKSYVESLPLGLLHVVDEEGSNFSVGQKQLVCLARALLRRSRILVLDEATAAVDLETDDFIQNTIRDQFKDCTVITIAHRLNTILDSDRVMVLEKGKVVEFESPSILLSRPSSLFYGLAKEVGLS